MKEFIVYSTVAILCLYFNEEIDILIDNHCYFMVLFINSIYLLFCIILQCINKNNNWLMLFPTVVLNNVILVIFSLWYLDNIINTKYSIIRKAACIPGFIILYDIIFYLGHRDLHTKYLYSFHKKHHSTYADTAISGYYMGILDFIIEVIIPFFLTQYLLGNDKTIIIMYSTIGQINTAISHGGYKLPLFPYCDDHYIHHIKEKSNYGILFMDYIFDTKYLK